MSKKKSGKRQPSNKKRSSASKSARRGQYSAGSMHGAGVLDMVSVLNTNFLMTEANLGNAEALFTLGCLYLFGSANIAQDLDKAIELLTKSAEQGFVEAQSALGRLYLQDDPSDILSGIDNSYHSPEKALKWLTMAADQDDVGSMITLGISFLEGTGLPQDNEQAFKWFAKAALLGDSTGMYLLAKCYAYGYGVEADLAEAQKLLYQVEQQGLDSLTPAVLDDLNTTAKFIANQLDQGSK